MDTINKPKGPEKYQLPREIVKRSEADEWFYAKLEWEWTEIYLSIGTCLCGKHPIKEICIIRNTKNGTTTEV
ncbi:MAG: hypothetical protein ABEH43_02980, partial [Flavobacteriales bacterium]